MRKWVQNTPWDFNIRLNRTDSLPFWIGLLSLKNPLEHAVCGLKIFILQNKMYIIYTNQDGNQDGNQDVNQEAPTFNPYVEIKVI